MYVIAHTVHTSLYRAAGARKVRMDIQQRVCGCPYRYSFLLLSFPENAAEVLESLQGKSSQNGET